MNIAIDFDGVICRRVGIPTIRDWKHSEPMDGALDAINLLIKNGHKIWVFTSNPEPQLVEEWLKEKKFPKLEVTNIKLPAHAYIDDRAIRFTNWQDIRKYWG